MVLFGRFSSNAALDSNTTRQTTMAWHALCNNVRRPSPYLKDGGNGKNVVGLVALSYSVNILKADGFHTRRKVDECFYYWMILLYLLKARSKANSLGEAELRVKYVLGKIRPRVAGYHALHRRVFHY